MLLPTFLLAQYYHFKVINAGSPVGSSCAPVTLFDHSRCGFYDFTLGAGARIRQTWQYIPGIGFGLDWSNEGDLTFPEDEGYLDADRLPDRLETGMDTSWTHNLIRTYESSCSTTVPTRISWTLSMPGNELASWFGYLPGDLDGDSQNELVYNRSDTGAVFVMENVRNDSNRPVWNGCGHDLTSGGAIAFGDFDQDGAQDFALSGAGWNNWVDVFENAGPSQYRLAFRDTITLPNGHLDAFSGSNVTGDHRPAFFVNFLRFMGSDYCQFYLYMWQATGPDQYRRVIVDTGTSASYGSDYCRSRCADVDGDGIEEVVEAAGNLVQVWKYNPERDTFDYICYHWSNRLATCINCADVNGDGYNEIIASHFDPPPATCEILEVEGVRVLRPNGGEVYSAGSQISLHWATYHPPRCDSLSLLYSLDNGRHYTPIATGIPGSDTSLPWTVPNLLSDSCKVKAIAYGPGWLADESDGRFRIVATGVEEQPAIIYSTQLLDLPNPLSRAASIRFQLRSRGLVNLRIRDISGRTVANLADRILPAGAYGFAWDVSRVSNGIYFLSFDAPGCSERKKLVVMK